MTDVMTTEDHGRVTGPDSVRFERLLPGPVDRVWSYLVDSDKRSRWLAGGPMELRAGGAVHLTWRNDELTDPPGKRPEGFGEEHSMESEITECDPPRRLAFTWGAGEVSFTLAPQGTKVLLTLVHTRISDRRNMVMIGAGWHAHVDILSARLSETRPRPFWDHWQVLREDYEKIIPA